MYCFVRFFLILNSVCVSFACAADSCPVAAGKYVGVAHEYISKDEMVLSQDGNDIDLKIDKDGKRGLEDFRLEI